MRDTLKPEEAHFRMAWQRRNYAPRALLEVYEEPGINKRAACFIRLGDISSFEIFRFWANCAHDVVESCAVAHDLPWLGQITNFTDKPEYLIDSAEKNLQIWVNVAAGTSPEEYQRITTDATIAARIWADTMKGSTTPELTEIQLRSKYPTPSYDTRKLYATNAEAVTAALLAQLRSHDGEG